MYRHCLLLLLTSALSAAASAGEDAVAAVNALRQAAGLPALAVSENLTRAAAAHADYLAMHRDGRQGPAGLSAHAERPGLAGFTGEDPQARALAAGYPHRLVRENVSMGYADLDAALDGLMGAIYHRLTFLDLDADEIGAHSAQKAQVFVLGRGDIGRICRQPPAAAVFQTPVDCLGQPMTREHYRRLCADLPEEALYEAPHPLRCANGQRLDADFMRELCRTPPRAARFAGQGRYYLPCGDTGPRIDGAWFDTLCEAPPAAAAYTASGRYYALCEPPRQVAEAWLRGHCATLPEDARYRDSGRFRTPCSAPHELRVEYLDAVDRQRRARRPAVVMWPAEKAVDVPPAFFVEEPDPLPDYDVSGYPLSIQFNPVFADEVALARFELARIRDGAVLPEPAVRVMTAADDPNGQLSGHEFVLFPLERLAWGGHYLALVEASVDGERRQYSWRFRVRDHGLPVLTVDEAEKSFVVRSGQAYLLYLPPLPEHPLTVLSSRVEHLRGNHVKLEVVDPNTLKVQIEARYCDRARITVDDGRSVELVPAGCGAAAGIMNTNRTGGR